MIAELHLGFQLLSDLIFITFYGLRSRVFVVLDPLVGQLRGTLYGIDRNGKLRIFSGKVRRLTIFFRESDLHGKLFSGLLSDQLVFKARNKLSGAKLQILLFRCTAVKLLSVNRTAVVNIYSIAFLRRLLNGLQILLQSLINRCGHIRIRYFLHRCHRYADLLDIRKRNLSHFRNLRLFGNLHVLQLFNFRTVLCQRGRAGIGGGRLRRGCLVLLCAVCRFLSARCGKKRHGKNRRTQ